MTQMQTSIDHEKLAELLPWYVNGTLDESEHAHVHRHIEVCEECRDSVDMLGRMRHAMRNDSTAPLVPAPREDRLLVALDESQRAPQPVRWPWYAAVASLAIIAVAAAVMLRAGPAEPPSRFETVTSPASQEPINYVVDLQLAPGVAAESRYALFEFLQVGDSAVATGENSYRVTLELGAVSLSELDQFVEGLESRSEIASASVVAVQLPVE